MDWKLELVILPVSDVDRAKAFYVDTIGFICDHDQRVNENLRFVQLTPPGSACSIAFGEGLMSPDTPPGSVKGLQVVVESAETARQELLSSGLNVGQVDVQAWGSFVYFKDPAMRGRCRSCRSGAERGEPGADVAPSLTWRNARQTVPVARYRSRAVRSASS